MDGFRFNQIGTMVTEEGGEAHTINLCERCYNERLARQGKQPVKAAEWRENCRAKSRKEYRVSVSKSPPVKEVLEQVKMHTDVGCDAYMMRRAHYAGRSGN